MNRIRHYEVTMQRKACLNANQSARKQVAHIWACSPDHALTVAAAKPEMAAFIAISARTAPPRES